MNAPTQDWLLANQRDLAAAIEALRLRLEQAHSKTEGDVQASPAVGEDVRPSTLQGLAESLGLSSFESSVLLLAAARELSSRFAATLAQLNGGRPWPTFSLALALLPGAHWSALAPDAPLRAWRLIELIGEGGLAERELRIDEPVLHWLAGLDVGDPVLAPPVRAGRATAPAPLRRGRAAWPARASARVRCR